MIRTSVVLLAASAVVAGCGTSSGSDEPAAAPASTWSTPYVDTTCENWINDMTQAQNLAAAKEFLGRAWTIGGESKRRPPAALVEKYKAAISDSCESAPADGIATAAARAYVLDKSTFKP